MSVAPQPSCDASLVHALPTAGTATTDTTYPRLVLATTILTSSLAFIDDSVINVGFPRSSW